jgi:hypothetical protein
MLETMATTMANIWLKRLLVGLVGGLVGVFAVLFISFFVSEKVIAYAPCDWDCRNDKCCGKQIACNPTPGDFGPQCGFVTCLGTTIPKDGICPY